jgi:hypothetical protein
MPETRQFFAGAALELFRVNGEAFLDRNEMRQVSPPARQR